MACLSVLVLLASAAPGRADQATGWRLDQVAGRRALARGELELAGELLATALGAAGQRPGRAAVLEDLFATGVLLADEGKTESAISALRTTLVGRQELYGADSAELEPHLTLLGTLELRTRGRRAREDRMLAVEHLHAARHILERTVGTDHPTARQAASLTVEALRKAGRRSEAAALARALGNRNGEVVPREEPSLDEDSAQLERLASMRRDLARRKSDEAAAIRAAPSGHPGQVLPAPGSEPVQEVRVAVAAPPVSPAPAVARPPPVPRLPSIRDHASEDPLRAQLQRYQRLLQAHEGWVRQAATRPTPREQRENQALSGLADLEELSYQADRLRLEAALDDRGDVTAAVDGLEARIEGLLPDYGALAGGFGGAL